MASAKDNPTPSTDKPSDDGFLLNDAVPVAERDGFGTIASTFVGVRDEHSDIDDLFCSSPRSSVAGA